MEKLDITYLEVLDLINNGITVYDTTGLIITEQHASDLFFLEEDSLQTFYIYEHY
jgi:hypothetical protein